MLNNGVVKESKRNILRIAERIMVVPRLTHAVVEGKTIHFKRGLNIIVTDLDEIAVIKQLFAKNNDYDELLPHISGGETFMLLCCGFSELRMPDKSFVVYRVFEQLDPKNLRVALKHLSKTRNQVILVTNTSHFRKLPGIKANIIRLKCAHPSAYSSQAL